jgi:hypothetical protein
MVENARAAESSLQESRHRVGQMESYIGEMRERICSALSVCGISASARSRRYDYSSEVCGAAELSGGEYNDPSDEKISEGSQWRRWDSRVHTPSVTVFLIQDA